MINARIPPLVLLALAFYALPATAQTRLPPGAGYPFCLRSSTSGAHECRYPSFEACLRDRAGAADCVLNPRLPPPSLID